MFIVDSGWYQYKRCYLSRPKITHSLGLSLFVNFDMTVSEKWQNIVLLFVKPAEECD